MAKVLLETTGQFQLVSPATRQGIQAHRPSVVTMEPFFNARMGLGQVKIISNSLRNDATDRAFAEFWDEAEGEREFAIESFRAKFDTLYEGKKEADGLPKEPEHPIDEPGAKGKKLKKGELELQPVPSPTTGT